MSIARLEERQRSGNSHNILFSSHPNCGQPPDGDSDGPCTSQPAQAVSNPTASRPIPTLFPGLYALNSRDLRYALSVLLSLVGSAHRSEKVTAFSWLAAASVDKGSLVEQWS